MGSWNLGKGVLSKKPWRGFCKKKCSLRHAREGMKSLRKGPKYTLNLPASGQSKGRRGVKSREIQETILSTTSEAGMRVA